MSSDDSDEDIEIKSDVQKLKLTRMPNITNSSRQMRDEILESVDELKNDLKNNVKKDSDQIERARKAFGKIHEKLGNTEEKVLKEMENSPPEVQESIATFWEISSDFLTKLFNWIWIKFNKLINLIKRGLSYLANKIESFFYSATNWIREIFR